MKLQHILFGAAMALAACHHKDSGTTTATPEAKGGSLYQRLGEKPAITAVVKDFVEEEVLKDDRIKMSFANADGPHLEAMLVDQICEATGGPCKYTGKDMKTAHTNMHITDAQFTALVEDLKKSLDKFKVGDKEQNELISALGGMKGDIVGQ